MSITGVESVRTAVGRWCPEDVALIEQVVVTRGREGSPATVRLTTLMQRRDTARGGWPAHGGPFQRVELTFNGVQELRLQYTSGQVMGFSIEELSDAQMEGMRYRIGDYEDDLLFFPCSEVSMSACSDDLAGTPGPTSTGP